MLGVTVGYDLAEDDQVGNSLVFLADGSEPGIGAIVQSFHHRCYECISDTHKEPMIYAISKISLVCCSGCRIVELVRSNMESSDELIHNLMWHG